MEIPTLHRNALLGLRAREQQAALRYMAEQEAIQRDTLQVLQGVEGAMGLVAGALGTTHTLDMDTMQVRRLPDPEQDFTPAPEV